MYSVAVVSVLASLVVGSAALECPGSGAYYVCAENGFRGYCSTDPCDKIWCSDFSNGTCEKKNRTTTTPVTTARVTTTTVSASSTPSECPGRGSYYVCAKNGFRGYCSMDPCDKTWCSDFSDGTCEKSRTTTTPVTTTRVTTTTLSASSTQTECPGTGSYYVCYNNGFRGYCSKDPCAISWCPDFAPKSCNKIVKPRDDTVCPPGTGYFQKCAANGFRGCCKGDACGNTWCPDYKSGSYEPISAGFTTISASPVPSAKSLAARSDPSVCAPDQGYYQVCGNGFKGCCKSDACTLGYCPATPATTPSSTSNNTPSNTDTNVCTADQGYYQVCSNGFKGCCKSDACSLGYCPASPTTGSTPGKTDSTVCTPEQGYYQVCGNGFKGCCKSDACALGYCPSS